MKPRTFNSIMKDAMKRGLSKERAQKEAGKAYWDAARSKYKGRKKNGR